MSRTAQISPDVRLPDESANHGQVAVPALSSGSPLVAALFVQADGCYAALENVDAWPESRDARRYAGPLPVVAHPPCQRWGNLASVNFSRWGGVLEHPAQSRAWPAHGLLAPVSIGWQRGLFGGWVCEVWQSAYGHRANKATWLYYNGENPPHELRWARIVGTHQVGGKFGTDIPKPTLTKREANATPLEFRDELLRLALLANGRSEPAQPPISK